MLGEGTWHPFRDRRSARGSRPSRAPRRISAAARRASWSEVSCKFPDQIRGAVPLHNERVASSAASQSATPSNIVLDHLRAAPAEAQSVFSPAAFPQSATSPSHLTRQKTANRLRNTADVSGSARTLVAANLLILLRETVELNQYIVCGRNEHGGGSGIRTHDTVARIHAFQACAFSHSAIPPLGNGGNIEPATLSASRPAGGGCPGPNPCAECAPAGRLPCQ